MEEVRYNIPDLTKLEYLLIINALKIWRGDFGDNINTKIWHKELDNFIKKLPELDEGAR